MPLSDDSPIAPADGTVDWSASDPAVRAAALLSQDADPTADGDGAAFAPRQIEYKGKTYTARSADELEALNAIIGDHRSANGRIAEAAQLRERIARLEGRHEATPEPTAAPIPEPEFPSIELARQDPERWRADMITYNAQVRARDRADIEESVRTEFSNRERAATEKETARSWGEGFYARHAHLNTRHRRTIVQDVYRDHRTEIAAFGDDVVGAYDRLAELTEAAVQEVAGGTPAASRDTTRPPRLEGPSARPAQARTEPERAPRTGATWSQKERARLRGDLPNGGRA